MIERVVVDSNVLIAIDRGDRDAWRRLKLLVDLLFQHVEGGRNLAGLDPLLQRSKGLLQAGLLFGRRGRQGRGNAWRRRTAGPLRLQLLTGPPFGAEHADRGIHDLRLCFVDAVGAAGKIEHTVHLAIRPHLRHAAPAQA